MNSDSDDSVDSESVVAVELVERWRQGDEAAANELYRRFVQSLLRVAGQHLSQRLKSRVDEDDVVQMVFRTFFKRTQSLDEGIRFQFQNDDDLWKLLVTLTLNKARTVAQEQKAQKRDAGKEVSLSHDQFSLETASTLTRQANHEDAVILTDLIEGLMGTLKPQQAQIFRLRFEQYTQVEIADELDISERTVRRSLIQIRDRLSWAAGQEE